MKLKQNILFQDNDGAIRMEKYGKNSYTWNYRHIYIHYFFVKDWVDSNDVLISYCSKEHMIY